MPTDTAARKKAVLLFDTGTDQDRIAIDAFRKRYPDPEEVELIVVATVPNGWNGDFSALDNPAYLNTKSRWLFDKTKVNRLILAEEDKEGKSRTPSVEKVVQAIDALNVDIKGILPTAHHAWNEVGIAKIAEEISKKQPDFKYTPVRAIEICNDKPQFNTFLQDIKDSDPQGLPELVIPEERVCGATEKSGIREAAHKLHLKVSKKARDADREKAASEIREAIQTLKEEIKAAGRSGKLMLKPTWGGGSMGALPIESDATSEEIEEIINKHLDERAWMPSFGGPERSVVQEYVGNKEVGIHAIQNGDEIFIDMTMKEMHKGKESSHFVPGKDDPLRPEYDKYKEAISPVIKEIYAKFKADGMDLRHLNLDVRVWEEGDNLRFSIVDAQARCGLGHPEMFNYVYATDMEITRAEYDDMDGETLMSANMADPGIEDFTIRVGQHIPDVDGMLTALSLDLEDPASVLQELNSLEANFSATIDTLYTQGGKLLVSPTIKNSDFPGAFYTSSVLPENGDIVSDMQSMLDTDGHFVVGTWGPTLDNAVLCTNNITNTYIAIADGVMPSEDPDHSRFKFVKITHKGGREMQEPPLPRAYPLPFPPKLEGWYMAFTQDELDGSNINYRELNYTEDYLYRMLPKPELEGKKLVLVYATTPGMQAVIQEKYDNHEGHFVEKYNPNPVSEYYDIFYGSRNLTDEELQRYISDDQLPPNYIWSRIDQLRSNVAREEASRKNAARYDEFFPVPEGTGLTENILQSYVLNGSSSPGAHTFSELDRTRLSILMDVEHINRNLPPSPINEGEIPDYTIVNYSPRTDGHLKRGDLMGISKTPNARRGMEQVREEQPVLAR